MNHDAEFMKSVAVYKAKISLDNYKTILSFLEEEDFTIEELKATLEVTINILEATIDTDQVLNLGVLTNTMKENAEQNKE